MRNSHNQLANPPNEYELARELEKARLVRPNADIVELTATWGVNRAEAHAAKPRHLTLVKPVVNVEPVTETAPAAERQQHSAEG